MVAIVALFVMSDKTALRMQPAPSSLGVSTPVRVEAANRYGIRRISARVEQAGQEYTVFEQRWPSHRLLFWRRHEAPLALTFNAGKTKAPNLKEGKARLIVEAVSNDMAGRTTETSTDVNVVLSAPRVIPDEL